MSELYTLDKTAVFDKLGVNPEQGLSSTDVADRQKQYGKNELVEKEQTSLLSIFIDQFKDAMVFILIGAAIVSFVLGYSHGEYIDTVVILLIVVINAVLGFVQEYRAEQAMQALKAMAAPNVKVRRDGRVSTIEAKELVPGDIVLIEAGDAISADAYLIEANNLRTQEASLTGESEPINKTTKPSAANAGIGDRKNMTFVGTSAIYGRGTAVVTDTGMNTELGRIAELIQNVETEDTPLQKRMAYLGKVLAFVAFGIIALVVILGWFRGESWEELILTAIAMAVAAIPEGLPAVITISLALGAQQMLKQNALIRKLPAVETLGSITTICSDKTGTLTQNRMTVQMLDMADQTITLKGFKEDNEPVFELVDGQDDKVELELLLVGSALNNDAILRQDPAKAGAWETLGDPTEAAMLVAAQQNGFVKADLDRIFPRVGEIPFSSERKRMTTIHKITPETLSEIDPDLVPLIGDVSYAGFTKGAIDRVLARSTKIWVHDELHELDATWHKRIIESHDRMAAEGMRVLSLGVQFLNDVPDTEDVEAVENDLTFVGLMGMIDPPRPEVKLAVEQSKMAGIRPIMITGDHPITAKEIAKQLGIAEADSQVVTGTELEEMSDTDIENIVEDVPVFARVSPEHKLRIVGALQNKGHVTAMTGDGVNDAPALRKADIGVAMGITGTDVSKEAAEMVILDDNFATIVSAIKEGRTIYDNVRKFMQSLMTSNAAEIYVMLAAPFLGMPLPLLPLQILWINLVTDGLPALALSVEPSEADTMTRAPFAPDESIFSRGIGWRILWGGLLIAIVSLGIGYAGFSGLLSTAYEVGSEAFTSWWRTMVFMTLTISQLFNALAVRSNRDSIFKIGLFSNRMMLYAFLITFPLQLLVIYWSPLASIFDTVPLSFRDLMITLVLSTFIFWGIELEKVFRKG